MEGSIGKNFMKYVSLNILAMMGSSAYIFVDTYFVANGVGIIGLSALNLAIALFSLMQACGLMIGIGGATRFAIDRARGDGASGNRAFTVSAKLGLMVGIGFFLAGMFFAKPIAYGLGANEETIALTSIYLKTIMTFAPFFILNHVLVAFVRNDGEPRLATIGILLGNLFNVIFDYVFIFPFGWGMFGAALATGISPIVSMLVLSIHFIKKKNSFRLSKGKTEKFGTQVIKTCGLGGFAFVNEAAVGMVILVFNLLCLGLGGNTAVAAYGIVANVALIAVAAFTGVAQGTQPLISDCYGRGNMVDIQKIYKWALTLSMIMASGLFIISLLYNTEIANLFNKDNDPKLTEIAAQGLWIYFAGFFFAGINIVTAGYLAAKEKASGGFIISLCRGMLVVIPVAIILSKLAGITGVWLSFAVAEGVTVVVSLIVRHRAEK